VYQTQLFVPYVSLESSFPPNLTTRSNKHFTGGDDDEACGVADAGARGGGGGEGEGGGEWTAGEGGGGHGAGDAAEEQGGAREGEA